MCIHSYPLLPSLVSSARLLLHSQLLLSMLTLPPPGSTLSWRQSAALLRSFSHFIIIPVLIFHFPPTLISEFARLFLTVVVWRLSGGCWNPDDTCSKGLLSRARARTVSKETDANTSAHAKRQTTLPSKQNKKKRKKITLFHTVVT